MNYFCGMVDRRKLGHRVLKLPSLPVNHKAKGIEPQQDEMVSHV